MTTEQLTVQVAGIPVGTLFFEDYAYSFRYDQPRHLDPRTRLASLTMPVRARSYDTQMLPPPFQSVLPEGELLIRLQARFGKVLRLDDDFGLLRFVGGNTVGRVTFLDPEGAAVAGVEPEVSLEAVLRHPDARELLGQLVERYGFRFGVGGAQPKAITGGISGRAALSTERLLIKIAGVDYPQLPVNEHFCMQACRTAQVPTAETWLADRHEILAVRRFDRNENGHAIGFEEMCALLRLGRHGKYDGSYEAIAEVVRRIPCRHTQRALGDLFAMVTLAMTLRNGDAHLRNFGVVYEHSDAVHLAPAYDMVTTTVYIAGDQPALTLGGRKQWPDLGALQAFGLGPCNLRRPAVRGVIDRVAGAVEQTRVEVERFGREHPAHARLCRAMATEWTRGLEALVAR